MLETDDFYVMIGMEGDLPYRCTGPTAGSELLEGGYVDFVAWAADFSWGLLLDHEGGTTYAWDWP